MALHRRWPVLLTLTLVVACSAAETTEKVPGDGIPPERVVDYIHTVLQADRTTYAEKVVQRLQNEEEVIKANEHFEAEKALPLPAQMFRMGAQLASSSGGLQYALISSWAINKANLPKTEIEEAGLAAVVANPDEPYRSYQTVGGKRYFTAVYADRAVSLACVTCHNEHPESPRSDFEKGDVIGGVVINLPLD